MSDNRFPIRKAAVLGAGVMGAQIAAHLVNAGVPVVLFDLAAKEGDPNGIVAKALAGLAKLEPAPLATAGALAYIDAANYDRDLALLSGCDLVIEAIAERMDWKRDLYAKIGPHLAPHAIVASNTSGLRISEMLQGRSQSFKEHFIVMHFFNPVRYMKLLELVCGPETSASVLARVRYKDPGGAASVQTLPEGTVRVLFDEPRRAITPGQSVAFYEGDDVVGGGVIDRVID